MQAEKLIFDFMYGIYYKALLTNSIETQLENAYLFETQSAGEFHRIVLALIHSFLFNGILEKYTDFF